MDGIYSLSLYGQLFDEQTVVEEINRLTYGSIISYDITNRKVSKKKYFRLFNEQITTKYIIDKSLGNKAYLY